MARNLPTTTADVSALSDPAHLMHLLENLTPNPLTGQIGPEDVMRYMIHNMHTPEIQSMMQPMVKAYWDDQAAAAQVDHADIDYASLPFQDDAWVLSVNPDGQAVDASGGRVAPGTPGSHIEHLVCVNNIGVPRYYSPSVGLPDSQTVLRTLKRAMARPFVLFTPSLPKLLLIPIDMEHHVPTLKPFLDSLPAPFTYRVEDADAHERTEAYEEMKAEADYTQLMRLARKHKDAANVEFKARLRERALKQYTLAIDCAWRAREKAHDHEDEKIESQALLAVCYSNRAATYLLPGAGMDTKLARIDAEKAIMADVLYVKGHIRLVRSFEAEGDIPGAAEASRQALGIPDLAQDAVLLQLFQELKTKYGDAVQ